MAQPQQQQGFARAEKRRAKLRLALIGPAGSGKTYSALAIGHALAEHEGGRPDAPRMAMIDTEHASGSLYADTFAFDCLDLGNHDPRQYIAALELAARMGYKVVLIDSLSHAWSGRGGALEQVDAQAAREKGNSFAAWRSITPLHNKLVDAILAYPGHVIATMRSKTEYVIEKDERSGKSAPRRVGTSPVMRDGIEYEFTVAGDMDLEHRLVITKSRCATLADAVIEKPGKPLADTLWHWLNTGSEALPAPVAATPAATPAPAAAAKPPDPTYRTAQLKALSTDLAQRLGGDLQEVRRQLGRMYNQELVDLGLPPNTKPDDIAAEDFDGVLQRLGEECDAIVAEAQALDKAAPAEAADPAAFL